MTEPFAETLRPLEAHIVSHTHWDREWYLPASRFRQRLVELIDELLADTDGGSAFLLDGQMVVLEDYLAVRPERRAEISKRLREGALEAGPWYVLADELIPSGEALVRNLLTGRRSARALRATSPPVLYCPDSFGHPASLPSLAAGFGLPVIILWRGYGGARWPAGDAARWSAPDGSTAIIYHLPRSGYEFAAQLPAEDDRAAARWAAMRAELAPRSTSGVALLPNGADHHARQLRLHEAIAALKRIATGDSIEESSLSRFAQRLGEATETLTLPEVRGELRDSYGYTWALQGTFGTRAHQKRANARAERALLREAEPWSTIAWARGAFSRRPLLEAAWQTLLRCHPHDTLCGCSIDEVARAMDVRLDDAVVEANGVRDDALLDLVGHDPERARSGRDAWREVVIVRNPVVRPRGGVAELDIRRFLADVPIGPGSAHPPPLPRLRLPPPELDGDRYLIQILSRDVGHDRVEASRHYPDDDLVEITRALAWIPPIAGYGTRAFSLNGEPAEPMTLPSPVHVGAMMMTNGLLTVSIDDRGSVQVESHQTGMVIAGVLRFEDEPDVGDLYTRGAAGDALTHATFLGAHVVHRGPLRGAIQGRWRLRLPQPSVTGHDHHALIGYSGTAAVDDATAHAGVATIEVTAEISLDAGEDFIRAEIDGHNTVGDHRLRVVFATAIAQPDVWADAAFGPVLRRPIIVPEEDRRSELPPPTAPLHRYVSLFDAERGATIISDGLAEYEAGNDGSVAITLVRAIGQLSRNDIPERPGHAGWPVPTPMAQCIGAFSGRFALFLHGPRSTEAIARIEMTADDVLLPLQGTSLRSALAVSPPTAGLELAGDGLAFSTLKESDDGAGVVLRCVNLLDAEVAGRWTLGFPAREAHLARLDETPLSQLPLDGSVIAFTAAPRAIVTILVR